MTASTQTRITYPTQGLDYRDNPIIQSLLDAGTDARVDLPRGMFTNVTEGTLHKALEQARATNNLEPLETILALIKGGGSHLYNEEIKTALITPYEEHLQRLRQELSGTISFQVQITPDNILGDALLKSGKLLLRSGQRFLPFKYATSSKGNYVVFEKLPPLETESLEQAVEQVHEQDLIESIIRVKAQKPYPVRETILPYFGHRLIG